MKLNKLFRDIQRKHHPKTTKGKRQVIRRTIVDLLLAGLSRKDIIAGYRAIGLGVSNDEFNKLFKETRPNPVGERYFKSLKPNEKPDIKQFALSKREFFRNMKYRFVGVIVFKDGAETITDRMAVDVNNIPTVAEIHEYLTQRLCDSSYRYCQNIISITLVGAYIHD